jgi:hypothetical protein
MVARQALYHLSCFANPLFALVISETESHIYSWTAILLVELPCVARKTGTCHWLRLESNNFFAQASLKP